MVRVNYMFSTLLSILQTVGLILLVVIFFNIMIFVHELGHFWAGRWRGAYIDRFQIWFGKPIWVKKINGVEWALGWIPAGGFVSLPQLGDMEAIEGECLDHEALAKHKPLTALDKVIIAAAGPIFSLLLAFVFAIVVWGVGRPSASISNTVGYVVPESPAAQSGLLPGDRIIAVDGQPVTEWVGDMKGVSEAIALSENEKVTLSVERPQPDGSVKKMDIVSSYELPDTSWWQRSGMRRIGVMPSFGSTIGSISPHSPADEAGLKVGDRIIKVNGTPVYNPETVMSISKEGKPLQLTITRDDKELVVTLTPVVPLNWEDQEGARALMGIGWAADEVSMSMQHPDPFSQVTQSLRWMKETLAKVISPSSDVGVEHLSGPVGIGNHIYTMLTAPDGWRFVLWFAVILNVNLAVLNMLPLPVVDGGHVVLGLTEMILGRPVGGAVLAWIQTGFVFVMMGFFLFVTLKDVGDLFGSGTTDKTELPQPVFKQ